MDMLFNMGSFVLKSAVVLVVILIVVAAIAAAAKRRSKETDGDLRVTRLNQRFRRLINAAKRAGMKAKAYKAEVKQENKQEKKTTGDRRRLYVLDFDADMTASAVESLREEVSALVGAANDGDEALVRVSSAGGLVHTYGLAASQLRRIRDHGIRLTASVDKVAASGGYLVACVADELIAAPFSIIGSIGVVAQVPNLHRFLKEHNVDYEEMTAGEFKRTVSVLGEITKEGRDKFQEQLEDTHKLFKEFVVRHRPGVTIDAVSTGEYWFGERAKELGLVDRLITSDDELMGARDRFEIIHLSYERPGRLRRSLGRAAAEATDWLAARWMERANRSRYL